MGDRGSFTSVRWSKAHLIVVLVREISYPSRLHLPVVSSKYEHSRAAFDAYWPSSRARRHAQSSFQLAQSSAPPRTPERPRSSTHHEHIAPWGHARAWRAVFPSAILSTHVLVVKGPLFKVPVNYSVNTCTSSQEKCRGWVGGKSLHRRNQRPLPLPQFRRSSPGS